MDRISVSVIIPTLNSPGLAATLAAIQRQTAFDRVVEVIVAGQQHPLLGNLIPRLTYLQVDQSPTAAHNRNVAAQHARGEILCFTDADCLPEPDWIEKLLLANPQEYILAGGVKVPPRMPYWGTCDHLLGFSLQADGIARKRTVEYGATLNFCMLRETFLEMGGFDESFALFGEDREFCWRLVNAGHTIQIEPSAIVTHNHPRTNFRYAWQHQYAYGRATAQFRLRHIEDTTRLWRLGRSILRLPGLGEVAGMTRVTIRALARAFQLDTLPTVWKYLPGIFVLDLAHTLGLMNGIRTLAP